eukprot:gene10581-14206_t
MDRTATRLLSRTAPLAMAGTARAGNEADGKETAMSDLSEAGRQALNDIAARHGVSFDAVEHLLRAVMAGQTTQAQFNHPELGGMGQWSQGGMTMIGDMFNNGLKARVDGLCNELSTLIRNTNVYQPPVAASSQSQSQSQGGGGASLFVAGLAFGATSPNVFAIGQTLAGPRAAGKWIGVQNCFGNIAGIIGPIITGFLVDSSGGFTSAFGVAAGVAVLGMIGWGVIIPRIAVVKWTHQQSRQIMLVLPVARAAYRSPSRDRLQTLGLAGVLIALLAMPAYIVLETWLN